MQLLQIPAAVPLLSILPVRARVLIDGEYPLSADDPSDVAHHVQLFRRVQVVQRKTDPYNADRIAPVLQRLDKVAQLSTRSVCSAISSAECETSMP